MSNSINRSRLMKLAVMSSLGGKGFSVITQLIALPLAVTALGVDRFGVYAMLTAVFIWSNTASAIVGSALSLQLVAAHARNDMPQEARLFSTAFFVALVLAVVLALLFQAALYLTDLNQLFGLNGNEHNTELRTAALCISILLPINIVASLSESAQSGYQKQYVTNIMMAISNVVVIACLVKVQTIPSIAALVLAVFGPPLAARIANLALLWKAKSYLLPKIQFFQWRTLFSLLRLGVAFALMQLGSFAYLQFPIFYVGRELGPTNAAYFAAMMQIISMSGSLLILFTQPLLPALRDATIRNEFTWARNIYRITLTRLVPYIVLASCGIALAGIDIISILLRHTVSLESLTNRLWAAFFLIVAVEHIGYIFLAGIGRIWTATILYLAGAIVMLLTILILLPNHGLNGAFLAMCLGPIIATLFFYPFITNRELAQGKYGYS